MNLEALPRIIKLETYMGNDQLTILLEFIEPRG